MENLLTVLSQLGFGGVIVWFLYYIVTKHLPAQTDAFRQEVNRERELYLHLLTEERALRAKADEATVAAIREFARVSQLEYREFMVLMRAIQESVTEGFQQLALMGEDNRELLESVVRPGDLAFRKRRRRAPGDSGSPPPSADDSGVIPPRT